MPVVEKTEAPSEQYISIAEFAKLCDIKEKTILKRQAKIPGVEKHGGAYRVLVGTRYPMQTGKFTIEDAEDRRYVLLQAISRYRYIDAGMLGIYPHSFEIYIKELESAGLIVNNNSINTEGANACDCTVNGSAILKKKKQQAKHDILNAIAAAVGHFAGAYSEHQG